MVFQLSKLLPTELARLERGAKAEAGGKSRGYRLAFTAPLTPFTAFCIALSQLSDKGT